MFTAEFNEVPFQELLFLAPQMQDASEALMVSSIIVNNEIILKKQSIHWERQDLLKRINDRIGADTDITSLELLGIYGPSAVIDELIDCLRIRINEGALKTLNLEILPHERLTALNTSVFEYLVGKCSDLTKFELQST